ncbi:MAG: GxxExxY protein [bacterium]
MELENLTQTIIGCAMAFHQSLGPGFLESVHQNALLIELRHAGLNCAVNSRIPVHYREENVGDFKADILVENLAILELKAVSDIHPTHEAQLVNYVHAKVLEIVQLSNFGSVRLEIKRKHKTYKPKSSPVPPANPVILSKKSSAFSLLEILVAVTVLSILLFVLLNIVQNSTSLWRAAENKMEAYREARAALQVMSSDLRNVLPTTNTNFFRTNLPTNSPNLAFLATLPLSSQNATSLSDVCTVGYFLAYDNKSPVAGASGRQSYNLYRYFVESNDTFKNLTNSPTTALTASFANTNCEILARNIIGFNATYSITNAPGFANWTQNATTPMPHIVEIKITAINNERTMRFGARGASGEWDTFKNSTNSPDYQKNTKTFTTRINLNTK